MGVAVAMVDVGRLRLEVAERGRGPAILFLHGYTDSWRSFEAVLGRLPESVRGIAVSQRGHGGSERPVSGYRMDDLARDAVALLDALDIDAAAVVGHSMGSLVAQELALARPDRVTHLVLAASATTFDTPLTRELEPAVNALSDPVPRAFAHEFQTSTVHRPLSEEQLAIFVGESVRVPAGVWKDALAGQLAFHSEDRIGRLRMPTLIVFGDHDVIATPAAHELLHQRIGGSRLVAYEDTGHALHWERPERFTEDVLAFVLGAGAPRTARDRGRRRVRHPAGPDIPM